MLYEYAIEPACFGDWQSFQHLVGQLGPSEGRLVSRFPNNWPRKVYDACLSLSFRQRGQLEIELKRIEKHALILSGRVCDKATWVESAIDQHNSGKPFHAIIVKQAPATADYLLHSEEITRTTPLWAVERERKVARTVDALGVAVAPLLRMSNRILFVDKMFNPDDLEFPRWRDTLQCFIAQAIQGQTDMPVFEYHCGIDQEEFGKPEVERTRYFQQVCQEKITPFLPVGVQITVTRWDQNYGGDFFHDRYILTEKGGIRIGWGLDRSKRPEETADVMLMEESMRQRCWNSFQAGATEYRFIDSVVIRSSN